MDKVVDQLGYAPGVVRQGGFKQPTVVRFACSLTPILIACGKPTHGYKTIAEMLIKKGANINIRDRLGYTLLLLALSGGTVEIAEMLIEKGADTSVSTRMEKLSCLWPKIWGIPGL